MEIIKGIIYFFIASGVLSWLIRSIVKLYLDKDVEKFKNDLERELEVHKTLHAERIIVIKEIYKKIYDTYKSLESLINPIQIFEDATEDEKRKLFVDNFNTFSNYFGENKIFFNEELSKDMDNYRKGIYDVWSQWSVHRELHKIGQSPISEWGEAWDKLQKEVPLLKEKLEKVFRKLIGVN